MVRIGKLGQAYKRRPPLEIRIPVKQNGRDAKEYELVFDEVTARKLYSDLGVALKMDPVETMKDEE